MSIYALLSERTLSPCNTLGLMVNSNGLFTYILASTIMCPLRSFAQHKNFIHTHSWMPNKIQFQHKRNNEHLHCIMKCFAATFAALRRLLHPLIFLYNKEGLHSISILTALRVPCFFFFCFPQKFIHALHSVYCFHTNTQQ